MIGPGTEGDSDLSALLLECRQAAFYAARAIVPSKALAQETAELALFFLKLKIAKGVPPENPHSWIKVVAKNAAKMLAKDPRSQTRFFEELPLSLRPGPLVEGTWQNGGNTSGEIFHRQ